MKASQGAPMYSIGFGTYEGLNVLTDSVTTKLQISENSSEIAMKATISMVNCITNGKLLSEIINVRDRIYIYANDGSKVEEVFRGFVWKKSYSNKQEQIISLTCYDNLIYLQKSEDSRFYPSGRNTQSIISDICSSWGVDLVYNYESISHKKLPLSGSLSSMLKDDLLEKVKKRTGVKYVLRSIEDTLHIDRVGYNANERIFEFYYESNVLTTVSEVTMDDMVTRIIFVGKADESGYVPVNSVMSGDTDRWGTIQKIIRDDTEVDDEESGSAYDDEDKMFSNCFDEGQYTLKENGNPKDTENVEAIDIPWLRKGEIIRLCAGDLVYRYIVTAVTHNAVTKKMKMDLEPADESKILLTPAAKASDMLYEIHVAGKAVELDNVPVYLSSDADTPAWYSSGKFYLYDGKEVSGRYRITEEKNLVGKKPVERWIAGWISAQYV